MVRRVVVIVIGGSVVGWVAISSSVVRRLGCLVVGVGVVVWRVSGVGQVEGETRRPCEAKLGAVTRSSCLVVCASCLLGSSVSVSLSRLISARTAGERHGTRRYNMPTCACFHSRARMATTIKG